MFKYITCIVLFLCVEMKYFLTWGDQYYSEVSIVNFWDVTPCILLDRRTVLE